MSPSRPQIHLPKVIGHRGAARDFGRRRYLLRRLRRDLLPRLWARRDIGVIRLLRPTIVPVGWRRCCRGYGIRVLIRVHLVEGVIGIGISPRPIPSWAPPRAEAKSPGYAAVPIMIPTPVPVVVPTTMPPAGAVPIGAAMPTASVLGKRRAYATERQRHGDNTCNSRELSHECLRRPIGRRLRASINGRLPRINEPTGARFPELRAHMAFYAPPPLAISRANRSIFAAIMKSFSWRPLIFFVRRETVA
jgi:hypothetical protein